MGTTQITHLQCLGSKNPAGVQGAGVDSDSTNNHYFNLEEGDILVAYNSGVSAVEVTLKSVADSKAGRVEDEIHDLAAGAFGFFGPFKADGWKNSSGQIDVDVETSTDVKFKVCRTAGTI